MKINLMTLLRNLESIAINIIKQKIDTNKIVKTNIPLFFNIIKYPNIKRFNVETLEKVGNNYIIKGKEELHKDNIVLNIEDLNEVELIEIASHLI